MLSAFLLCGILSLPNLSLTAPDVFLNHTSSLSLSLSNNLSVPLSSSFTSTSCELQKKKKPQLFPVASDLLHRCELLLSLCVCVCVKVGGVVKRQTEHKSKWDRQQERERESEGKKRKEGGGPGVYSVNTQSTIESRAWSPSLRWKLIDRLVSHLESTEIYRKPKRNHEQSRSLYQLHYIWKTLLFFFSFLNMKQLTSHKQNTHSRPQASALQL